MPTQMLEIIPAFVSVQQLYLKSAYDEWNKVCMVTFLYGIVHFEYSGRSEPKLRKYEKLQCKGESDIQICSNV